MILLNTNHNQFETICWSLNIQPIEKNLFAKLK